MTPLNEVMFQLQKHELNRDLTLHKGCYIPNIKNTVESLLNVLKSQKESINDLLDVQELVYHLVDENKTYRLRNISLEKALILNEVEMQKMREEVESIKQLL